MNNIGKSLYNTMIKTLENCYITETLENRYIKNTSKKHGEKTKKKRFFTFFLAPPTVLNMVLNTPAGFPAAFLKSRLINPGGFGF
jgi:hypothetical protein